MVRWAQSLLFVLSVLAVAACGNSNPVQPTPPSSGPPFATSIAIGGSTVLNNPGDTSQLTATVTYSDNSTRDVTAEATWTVIPGSAVTMTAPGLLSATGWGLGNVRASYLAVSRPAAIRVVPSGAFLVEGYVSPVGMGFTSGPDTISCQRQATRRCEPSGRDSGRKVVQMMVERDETMDIELERL